MSPSDERIAELEAENARVQALYEQSQVQIAGLLARVQELDARLAKVSHNSSKSPSSDPLGRKRPRSQRRRSGKKPGGQLGHHGETLHLVSTPDAVVEHRPTVCTSCQVPLDETVPAAGYERRQVHDLPPLARACSHRTPGLLSNPHRLAVTLPHGGTPSRSAAAFPLVRRSLPVTEPRYLGGRAGLEPAGARYVSRACQAAHTADPLRQGVRTVGATTIR